MNGPQHCDRYQEDLAELALGTLSGRRRAEALAHVEDCTRCAEEVEELSRTADLLLQVVPGADPPAGFEVRLLERVAEEAQPVSRRRPARRRRFASSRARLALSAAAVSVALAGGGIGIALAGTSSPAPPPAVQAALVSTPGHTVLGRVVASPGSPPLLFMAVQSGHLSGRVTCRLGLAGGRWVTVGTFSLSEGYGSWSARLWFSVSSLRQAELVSPQGAVVAIATFPLNA